jgi:tRNA (guanine-N7-)-methyltransferase
MDSIRSFALRKGRITDSQAKAIETLMPMHAIPYQSTPLEWGKIFNGKPLVLEIGFGMGDSLATMAQANPQLGFVGIEVHLPGVGRLLRLIESEQMDNLKIIHHDAVEVLQTMVSTAIFDRIHIFFPDPWPKKRHHKRRLIQPAFLQLVNKALKPGGMLHIATDWEHYAQAIQETLANTPDFMPFESSYPRQLRTDTKFEQRGLRLGHGVWDLLYLKRHIPTLL